MLLIVPDVHGDLNQFVYPLLYALEKIAADRREKIRVVYLGDYIDRGDSTAYIYYLMRYMLRHPRAIGNGKLRVVFLRGNHEVRDGITYDTVGFGKDNQMSSIFFQLFHDMYLPYFYMHHARSISPLVLSHAPVQGNTIAQLREYDEKDDDVAYQVTTGHVERAGESMTIRNIHGHTHRLGIPEVLLRMLRDRVFGTFGLDGDSSYGFRVVHNALQTSRARLKEVCSYVRFLVIEDGRRHELVERKVLLGASSDCNSKPLESITAMLRISIPPTRDILKLQTYDRTAIIEAFVANSRRTGANNVYMNDITCEMIGLKDFHPVWQVYYEDILMTIDDPAMRNRIRAAACKRYYPLFAQEAKGCSIISLLTAILLITLLVVVCCILAEKDYSRVAKEKEERDRWPWRMTIAT